MSGFTVETEELKQKGDYHEQAAEEAGKGVHATESVELGGVNGVLYRTHGPISGFSNDAIADKANQREEAGRAIQQACRSLNSKLNVAAAAYAGVDEIAEGMFDNQMQS
jgi:hypothetical protein